MSACVQLQKRRTFITHTKKLHNQNCSNSKIQATHVSSQHNVHYDFRFVQIEQCANERYNKWSVCAFFILLYLLICHSFNIHDCWCCVYVQMFSVAFYNKRIDQNWLRPRTTDCMFHMFAWVSCKKTNEFIIYFERNQWFQINLT